MPQMPENQRAALLMMASMATFTFNDACMKSLSDEIPLFQAIFLRGAMTSVMMIALATMLGGLNFSLSRRDWGLVALRTAAEVAAAFLFISALFNMPIGNATAILQALPLAVTLAGAVFLREAVGWRRMSAILIGFCGILMIVQPGADGFNAFSIYAILAVVAVTIRDLVVRRLSSDVPSMTVAVVAAVGVTVLSGFASLSETWVQPSPLAMAQLVGASVFIIGGYLFSVMTMRIGDIGFVAPFRYTSLLWALLLGFVIFGEWPNKLALAGISIVVATGLFTLLRERGQGRRSGPTGLRMR
ncbi:MAG: DMT family transporter [Paracoccaceae bacterium]